MVDSSSPLAYVKQRRSLSLAFLVKPENKNAKAQGRKVAKNEKSLLPAHFETHGIR